MKPIQIPLLAFVLFALARVAKKYKRREIPTQEFVSWMMVWIVAALVISIPDTTSFLASRLGIARGTDLIIYSGMLVTFYLIFRIHLALDRLEQEVTKIVRAIALGRMSEPIDPGSSDRA